MSKIKGRNEILIICDTQEFASEHILQIVTKAKKLAEINHKQVSALGIGVYDKQQLEELIVYGVDNAIICEQHSEKNSRMYCEIASRVIEERMPEVILFPASDFGKSIAAILSTRFDAGLIADCIDVEYTEDGDFHFSRTAINNSVIVKIKCINCDIKMGTIKKDVFVKKRHKEECNGRIVNFNYQDNHKRTNNFLEILEVMAREKNKEIDINKYKLVFSIGRGVENLAVKNKIVALAQKCGAGIVGTRAAVEENLIERERQVGQSGKSISPNLYVGFGVSGATQHMVGIKNANTIIAINSDPNAAIFEYADYSIIDSVEGIIDSMETLLLSTD